MARDYYLILGVGSDATPDQIKSAYRREAKRCHPDHSGEGSEPFLAVQEAYEVLGDPRRRRAYDDQLARESKGREAASRLGPEPLQPRRCPIEPLVPGRGTGSRGIPFGESPVSSLIEELFGPSAGDWDAAPRSQARRRGVGEIHVRVSLTPEQARHGGRVRAWLPGQVDCPSCQGWGRVGFFECPQCFGSGSVVDELPVDIAFPGGLTNGVQRVLPLRRLGLPDLSLVLHFYVREG